MVYGQQLKIFSRSYELVWSSNCRASVFVLRRKQLRRKKIARTFMRRLKSSKRDHIHMSSSSGLTNIQNYQIRSCLCLLWTNAEAKVHLFQFNILLLNQLFTLQSQIHLCHSNYIFLTIGDDSIEIFFLPIHITHHASIDVIFWSGYA